MKTVSVALVLCLNVGVDPPDVVKTTPCARLECWIGRLRAAKLQETFGLTDTEVSHVWSSQSCVLPEVKTEVSCRKSGG